MQITHQDWIDSDRRNYRLKKDRIDAALQGSTGMISGVTESNKEDIFYMLIFCLCVPQSKAIKAEEAVDILRKKDFYHKDLPRSVVSEALAKRVRFYINKTDSLMRACRQFCKEEQLWTYLQTIYAQYQALKGEEDRLYVLKSARVELSKLIHGFGTKLSSHFLRNIGMSGLAILDVHIIDGMQKRGLIPSGKLDLTTEQYYGIERIMRNYAEQVGIHIDALDLLLWSQKTGYVFK